MRSKLLIVYLNSVHPDRGFTMLEVLVSILVILAFVMGALQALAITAIVQIKAERQAQATFWIQQDLERVKSLASNFNDISGCGAATFDAGVGGIFRDSLASDTTVTAANSSDNNSQVVKTSFNDNQSRPIPDTANSKNASYSLVRIITEDDSDPSVLKVTYRVAKPYDTTKTYNSDSNQTHTQNSYLADDKSNNTSTLAVVSTEIIPHASFSCP
ncbi:type II secretion system protein [Crocosphaera sp. UHCC 0190]|uniref:type IV pilus modification PilV family protein n=1 Tax=Crocosphaera sp. UHCC 0190 TaxID=3110246 RepID=UPI002B221832|nr:type II secretion system protein [Crocosphaera sp. UHCC 0190]MEA5508559.1 type II secretion system protein [Crocosphaera sp. UHCC 0190]